MESSQLIPLGDLRPSATNPRTDLGDLSGLVDSIAQVGVLQPLLVRPTTEGGRFEIVAGHRRYEAARRVETVERVPCIVRTLTAVQALEIQIIENVQRKDITPLEEAEAFRRLRDDHSYDVETIVQKVGKSKAYVYARLKLTQLAPEARKAVGSGEFSASIGVLLARLPSPTLQAEATKELLAVAKNDREELTVDYAEQIIRDDFMRSLKGAPDEFDHAAVCSGMTTHPPTSCSDCPLRSGNLSESDRMGSADVCTDPTCFREKLDRTFEHLVQQGKGAGRVSLGQKKTKAIFHDLPNPGIRASLRYGSGYVELAAIPYGLGYNGPSKKTIGQYLGGWLKSEKHNPPTVYLAQDSNGWTHELLKEKDARRGLLHVGLDLGTSKSNTPKATKAERAKAKRSREELEETGKRIVEGILEGAARRKPDVRFWRMLAAFVLHYSDPDPAAKRRNLLDERTKDPVKALQAEIASVDEAELRGLVIELLLGDAPYGSWRGPEERLVSDFYNLDRSATARDVKAYLKAEAKS